VAATSKHIRRARVTLGVEMSDKATAGDGRSSDPPEKVADLANACARFVAARYGVPLGFDPDTLSLLDQWLRDARAGATPETLELAAAAAGAYLGEVIRRQFGANWQAEGDYPSWRLYLVPVYCAFNPVGMAREALLLAPADGWHAHFELDSADEEAIAERLRALPEVDEDEFYAPSTRFDVVDIVVSALQEAQRHRGLADVTFDADDYHDRSRDRAGRANGAPPDRRKVPPDGGPDLGG
jgi:hypothetical protein